MANYFQDPKIEICLFENMEKYPPIGVQQAFSFLNIRFEIKKKFNVTIPVSEIEKYIYSMYDSEFLAIDGKKLVPRQVDFKF